MKKIRPFPTLHPDAVTVCDVCLGDVYPGDMVHFIDGFVVCPECFFDFAFEYFSDRMVCGAEIREMTDTNDS